jgi:hypothetical protein
MGVQRHQALGVWNSQRAAFCKKCVSGACRGPESGSGARSKLTWRPSASGPPLRSVENSGQSLLLTVRTYVTKTLSDAEKLDSKTFCCAWEHQENRNGRQLCKDDFEVNDRCGCDEYTVNSTVSLVNNPSKNI